MILISSAGGVATTNLIDWVSKYKKTNNRGDKDRLKHAIEPPEKPNIEKAIYIFTKKPEEAAVSLINRFRQAQIRKLTKRRIIVEHPKQLMQYNRDLFNFKQIFKNWWFSSTKYSILFLNYDCMWDYVSDIVNFLEIDKKAINNFPAYIQRQAVKDLSENKKLHKHLLFVYANFKDFLSVFPDFYVKKA
jgi:hypothetical protein